MNGTRYLNRRWSLFVMLCAVVLIYEVLWPTGEAGRVCFWIGVTLIADWLAEMRNNAIGPQP